MKPEKSKLCCPFSPAGEDVRCEEGCGLWSKKWQVCALLLLAEHEVEANNYLLDEFKLLNTTLISIENKMGREKEQEEERVDCGKKMKCYVRIGPEDYPYHEFREAKECIYCGKSDNQDTMIQLHTPVDALGRRVEQWAHPVCATAAEVR